MTNHSASCLGYICTCDNCYRCEGIIKMLQAENARYREALEFYANKTNYSYYCYEYNLKTCGDDELGSHARKALKGME